MMASLLPMWHVLALLMSHFFLATNHIIPPFAVTFACKCFFLGGMLLQKCDGDFEEVGFI